jgi:hypothetical protein
MFAYGQYMRVTVSSNTLIRMFMILDISESSESLLLIS